MGPLQGTLLGRDEPHVDPGVPFERLALDAHSWVDVARGWLHGGDVLLDLLLATAPWRQGRRQMYDRFVDDPRLSCWFAQRDPAAPHRVLDEMAAALERRYRVPLGGVFLNCYRDGRDSVAPHRDRELRNVDDALVAIVTLGATRPFLVRPRGGGRSRDVRPGSGDLLVMGGACQRDWEHGVPKVASSGPRISLSWRWSATRGAHDLREVIDGKVVAP